MDNSNNNIDNSNNNIIKKEVSLKNRIEIYYTKYSIIVIFQIKH